MAFKSSKRRKGTAGNKSRPVAVEMMPFCFYRAGAKEKWPLAFLGLFRAQSQNRCPEDLEIGAILGGLRPGPACWPGPSS